MVIRNRNNISCLGSIELITNWLKLHSYSELEQTDADIKVTAQNFYDDILEYNMTSEFAFGNKIELYYNKSLSSELIEKLQPYKLDDHLYYMDKNLIWIFYE